MKKYLVLMLSLLISNAYALNLDIKTSDLSKDDSITIHMSTIKGDCSKGECSTSNDTSTFKYEKFLNYLGAINSNMADKKLVELSFDINDNSYASCQHLEATHGNETVHVTLSKTGCI